MCGIGSVAGGVGIDALEVAEEVVELQALIVVGMGEFVGSAFRGEGGAGAGVAGAGTAVEHVLGPEAGAELL